MRLLIIKNKHNHGKIRLSSISTHPGEIIKDELIARNLSQREFAKALGISYSVLNEILNGHRPITAKTALLFEASLGIPADALMIIQMKYNLQSARNNSEIKNWMSKIRQAVAVL